MPQLRDGLLNPVGGRSSGGRSRFRWVFVSFLATGLCPDMDFASEFVLSPKVLLFLVVVGIGGVAGLAVFWMATSGPFQAWARSEPQPSLEAGESVVREGFANRFVGAEAVGGRLILTDRHLRFEAHGANVQTQSWRVPLSGIQAVEATRTFGLIPNGVLLTLASGETEQFTTWDRDAWCRAVRSALDRRRKNGTD